MNESVNYISSWRHPCVTPATLPLWIPLLQWAVAAEVLLLWSNMCPHTELCPYVHFSSADMDQNTWRMWILMSDTPYTRLIWTVNKKHLVIMWVLGFSQWHSCGFCSSGKWYWVNA
jgi:hypothetical protein